METPRSITLAHMSVRVAAGQGPANIATGIPVLDHLLMLLARSGRFELALELPPDDAEAEVTDAGRALGEAFAPLLRADGAAGHGSAFMPADEALAQVAFETSSRPLVASNVDLTEARAGGLGSDLAARFLESFAHAAGLTLHVRLIDGEDSRHVLEAIFKALGAALSQACAR
jgi:imidazoleglycerol-phosphate dehydratase